MESTGRKEENLDEKEKLAEAGQQRQKAPQDTVVHVTELWRGWRGREREESREIKNDRGKQERIKISEKNPGRGSRGERGEKKVLHTRKHQLSSRKQRKSVNISRKGGSA